MMMDESDWENPDISLKEWNKAYFAGHDSGYKQGCETAQIQAFLAGAICGFSLSVVCISIWFFWK